jgi:peptidoglycan/LPS O-acetylase OafA/YrhL
MEKPTAQRSAALDTLRGIAVLLVLFRHMPLSEKLPEWLLAPLVILQRGGWAGVDLFFVLSGFLISGLLFREWQHSGKLKVGRFLIRRGFKIYPAFYVMLGAVFGWSIYYDRFPGWNYVLSEGLFVQNYGPSIFPHTWTLAVEEHFYLTLPLLLWLFRGKNQRPFALLPLFVLGVAVTCLFLRFMATAGVDPAALAKNDPYRLRSFYAATHLRCDSLFFGVLISWLYHFRRLTFDRIAKLHWLLLVVGIALFVPAFIFELGPTMPMYTWGFTALYLGSGALLIACFRNDWAFRPLAMVGYYSYSIYLWHIPIHRILLPMVFPRKLDPLMHLGIYFAATIAVGILLSFLIEIPALRFRDRMFPERDPSRR